MKRPGSLPTLSLPGLVCLLAMPAMAEPQFPDRDGKPFRFYGQVNQAYLFYDDGEESRGFLTVDNATNQDHSFIGFLYGGTLDNGIGIDGRFEWAVDPRPSDKVSLQAPSGPGYEIDSEDIEYLEARFTNFGYGTLYFGQGDMTGNLDAPDYSGTAVIAGPNTSQIAGGMVLRNADGTLSDRTLSEAIGTFDSGRKFRLRFDSPAERAFGYSASIGREVLTSGDDTTYLALGARYTHSGTYYDWAVVADVTTIEESEYAGKLAFGYLHKPSGLNLTLTVTHSTTEQHYLYLKAGIVRDIFAIGSTAVSVDYYNNGNWAAPGAETTSLGFAMVQRIDAANMELYAAVRNFDPYNNLDVPTENFEKSEAVMAGLRWSF